MKTNDAISTALFTMLLPCFVACKQTPTELPAGSAAPATGATVAPKASQPTGALQPTTTAVDVAKSAPTAQATAAPLAAIIKAHASVDFLFTGVDVPTLKQIMGNAEKADTQSYDLKVDGFESHYEVTKTPEFVQFFETKMVHWVTFRTYVTPTETYIGMVSSAQKDANGRGNDLSFYKLSTKSAVPPTSDIYDYAAISAFANGKCKVPKENIHFELKPNSTTILLSGFDIFLKGKTYTFVGELTLVGEKFVFNASKAKC
jgi:hypothetical protein